MGRPFSLGLAHLQRLAEEAIAFDKHFRASRGIVERVAKAVELQEQGRPTRILERAFQLLRVLFRHALVQRAVNQHDRGNDGTRMLCG